MFEVGSGQQRGSADTGLLKILNSGDEITRGSQSAERESSEGVFKSLNWLLYPFNKTKFFQEYYEREPLLIQRSDPQYFADLFSIDSVDHLISSLGAGDFRIVKDGDLEATRRASSRYGMANMEVLYNEISSGGTLILEAIQRRWAPVTYLCRNLERHFRCDVQANGYLTPVGSQGFPPHFDTHDVFVIQVEGQKSWKVYDSPVDLPLKEQQVPPNERPTDPGLPQMEFVLNPGDCLYIPRGFVHAAETQSQVSLHITIGLLTYSWAHLLIDLVSEMSLHDVALRTSVGNTGENSMSTKYPSLDQVATILSDISASPHLLPAIETLRQRFVDTRRPLLHGQLRHALGLSRVATGTLVKRRNGVMATVEADDSECSIRFHGKKVTFPRTASAELLWILKQESSFTAADIDGFCDEDSRVRIVARLVREGFLEAVGSRQDADSKAGSSLDATS